MRCRVKGLAISLVALTISWSFSKTTPARVRHGTKVFSMAVAEGSRSCSHCLSFHCHAAELAPVQASSFVRLTAPCASNPTVIFPDSPELYSLGSLHYRPMTTQTCHGCSAQSAASREGAEHTIELDSPASANGTSISQADAEPASCRLPWLPHRRFESFTPSWFTVTMGTGSVASTIAASPYSFHGQRPIAWAVRALNVLLFVWASLLFSARLLLMRRALHNVFSNPNEGLFLGAIPMSFSTITNGLVNIWRPTFGATAVAAAEVFFWANLPAVLGCVLIVPLYMVATAAGQKQGIEKFTAIWLMPVIPACVAANTAGVVATHMTTQVLRRQTHTHTHMTNPSRAVAMTAAGACLLGIGFLLSLQIVTIYWHRLIFHQLPPRDAIVSSFLPVGPMGMTVWALLNLSAAAAVQVPAYYMNNLSQHGMEEPAAAAGSNLVSLLMNRTSSSSSSSGGLLVQELLPNIGVAICAIVGLFLWGFAAWWLLLAVCSVVAVVKQGIPFNLGWWGAVFPIGVFTGATIQLGHALNSKAFSIMGATFVCVHVVVWLGVGGFTARGVWSGRLFHSPDCRRVEQTPTPDPPSSKVGQSRSGFSRA